MGDTRPYYDLDVWKKSRNLVSKVYQLSKKIPEEEKYSLTSQMRRSAVSVPSNIAEGVGRQYDNETIQFMFIARGSLYELETQFFLSFDQKYISLDELEVTLELVTECKKLIHGFINYLRRKKKSTQD